MLDPNGDGTGNGNGGNGCECVVDAQLSATSENAVQNKVIVGAMAEYTDALKQLKDQVDKMKPGVGESDVKSVFKQVFIQMNDKPNRPNGGSYSFETNAFTAPTGWSATTKNFNAEDDIWMSYCSFMSDGTDTGWSEPVRLIDYQGVFNKIENDMKDLYNKILDEANKNLDRVWEDAKDKLNGAKQDIETAKGQIADAKYMIEQAKTRIARLEDGYEFLTKIDDKTLGELRALAEWVDGNEGTVTTLINDINYIKGEIETHGQWIGTKEGVINEVSRKLSAAEGKIEDNATHINTVEGKVNSAGTRIDAVEASVSAQAKAIDTVNNTVGEVKSELVATKAMAQTAATWVDANQNKVNEAVQRIDGLHAEIVNEVSTAVGNEREHTESYVREQLNAEDAAWKVEVAKRYTKEETDQKIAAAAVEVTPEQILLALSNSQGAGAAIIAAINGSDSSVTIDADKILLNGEVIARLLGTERLVINKGNSVFEPDGSGYVANGNIRWNADASEIIIGDNAIVLNGNGSLKDINLPLVFDVEIIDNRTEDVEIPAPYTTNIVGVDNGKIFRGRRVSDEESESYTDYVIEEFEQYEHTGNHIDAVTKCGDTYFGFILYLKNEDQNRHGQRNICVVKSIDGVNWSFVTELGSFSEVDTSSEIFSPKCTYCIGNNIIFLLTNDGKHNGRTYCSNDGGETWTLSGTKLCRINAVNDLFIGFDFDDAVYVSQNGKDWTKITTIYSSSGDGSTNYESILGNCAAWFSGKYYIFSQHEYTESTSAANKHMSGVTYCSKDGVRWEETTSVSMKVGTIYLNGYDIPKYGVIENCFVKDDVFFCMITDGYLSDAWHPTPGTPYYTKDGKNWHKGRTGYASPQHPVNVYQTDKYAYILGGYVGISAGLYQTEGLTNISLIDAIIRLYDKTGLSI